MGCLLQIGVIGINHKVADLKFRESIARAAADLSGKKSIFFPHPILLLSTCNRTEIYFGGEDLATVHIDLLSYLRKQIVEPFEHRLYSYFGADCFAHLARVTAGLDSAVIAETEIQRQVKLAYAKGCEFSTLSSSMHYTFQKALKLGKLVRNQFPNHQKIPTLFQAIWELGLEHLGPLVNCRILLVGYSDLNRSIAFSLIKKGIGAFSMITQSPSSVHLPGCVAYDRTALADWIHYDLIICATSSDRHLLTGKSFRRQAIFDLSVPRVVDPKISLANQQLRLYNIEELNRWMERKKAVQSDQVAFCNQLVAKQVFFLSRAYEQKTLFRDHLEALGAVGKFP